MTMLVIDVSRNSIRQSFSDKGIVGTVHHVLWFRIFRPVLVISIWALLGLYVGYSISSVGPSGLPFEQLRLYGNIIAGMGGVLVVWLILSRLDRAIRRKMTRAKTPTLTPTAAASRAALRAQQTAWQRPRNTRLLVVDHDDDGDITHVRSWQEWSGRPAPAGTAAPATPFTRSPEYDPEEPVLSTGEVIVVDRADRAEPSLARAADAAPQAQPASQTSPAPQRREVVKAADAITAEAAGFHRFGYRGRLGRNDWVEPPEPASFAMRPGMARHYGGVSAVVHGRAATQVAGRASERRRTLHAFGAHAQLEDPYAAMERVERIDPLHGFGRRGNIVADED
ncbi:poly-beta-1,6-N-acetyl-D-glucosamine biosynthesis protein PgaD [Ralstonia sp. A12]|uniref:poly-beta-1,6-N-acetyl-D-glucosamine biosynthesis protein PgaD n=1 Tax=Ralstonia sp. A12 TaxID=1217052 RepID=UPI000575C835|nr:poly-beta-1,6-N-acetyl-D-glucosamine biosynthesis protein PgaD [Ralstonia sp. A12]KHK57913.1 poly-beta-1,6-N-acetyl-D-glucosamine biosynthesis protein PgaD [Ralstonia sp. A12]